MEQNKSIGRPGIEPQRYHNQIQQWLNDGMGINAITATMLQKAIGGQYKKAVTILDEFKAGYETKELSELPEPPEQLNNALNAASLEIWRLLWNQKNAEVNAARSEFEQEKSGLMSLAAERLELIDNLEEQLEQLRQVEQAANEKLALLSNENHDKDQELASLRERLQARDLQIEQGKQSVAELNERLTTEQSKHDAQLESTHKQHLDEMVGLRNELESKFVEIDSLQEQLTDALAKLKVSDLRVTDLTDQLADTKELADGLNQSLSEQQVRLMDEIEIEHNKLVESEKALAVMETKLANAEANASVASSRADKLQSELLSLAKSWKDDESSEEVALTDEQKQQINERLVSLDERGFTERDVIDAFHRLEKVFLEQIGGGVSFNNVLYAFSTWLQTCDDDAVVISTLSNVRVLRRLIDDELAK
ncbi:hypothetical protein [Vibrio hippocampi]|uniref:KfrA N-terminal DNA-binding domain-containing protein n=1 Tax=Vibrio hippocampi TaxID=654686 RepID=A0ABM8ZPE4_9VIBR|nr:hypothetical protein [Vibrio hippocampi]CAH0531257.1 hypothetical protein VHP8226_04194 [Vibrio hippocampi]